AAQTSAAKKSKGPRVLWGIQETWALIAIWEDRLDDLRRAKRNARVYADISARLRLQGYDRDVEQVHHKIENLASTYRKHQRTTTGSSEISWPFYWELHRFLGSLPLINTSPVVESSCPDQASPAMLEQVSKTRCEAPAEHDTLSECTADAQAADGGAQEDGAVASTSIAAGSDSQQSSASGDSTTGPRRDSAGSGGNSESSDSRREVQPRRKKRKRSPTPNAALIRAVIDEQLDALVMMHNKMFT
ncbi:myb/SANT-like DNA-binding domain-containing protein 1 isoform X2, partial [Ixodes scapularis]